MNYIWKSEYFYCLGLRKYINDHEFYGTLYVTDFDEKRRRNFSTNPNLQGLKVSINTEAEKIIPSEMIMELNVDKHMIEDFERQLYNVVPYNSYDYSDISKCFFEKEGIFACIKMERKEGEESFRLTSFIPLESENLKTITPEKEMDLASLVSRFVSFTSPSVFNSASRYFPISKYCNLEQSRKRVCLPDKNKSEERISYQDRTNNIAALAFRQYKSEDDTQALLVSDSEAAQPAQRIKSTAKSFNSIPANSFNSFLINILPFEGLLNVPRNLQQAKKSCVFETYASVVGVFPSSSFIIKPFARTMKVRSFKIFLAGSRSKSNDNPSQVISLELKSEKEICDFLEVLEVEELYDKFETIRSHLSILQSSEKPLKIKLKQRIAKTSTDITYAYWTPAITLREMIMSISG